MKCSKCNKNEATIHYAEIIDGKMKKLDLCEECSQSLGIGVSSSSPLSGFLGGLAEEEIPVTTNQQLCPNCKISYDDFKRIGRLGCSKCYETFNEALLSLIETIHKNTRHVGKVPTRFLKEFKAVNELENLEKNLKEAIELENFEKAALLRDEIRTFKEKTK